MTVPSAASLVDLVLGLALGASDEAAGNRCSLEGVSWKPGHEGAIELGIRKLEAQALRLASGPLVLEIGRVVVHELVGQMRIEAGRPHLSVVEAAEAELSGVRLHGPLILPPQLGALLGAFQARGGAVRAAGIGAGEAGAAEAGTWCLGPLATADGTIRGEITDAHLLFDAEVTVPIRHGRIDFNDATVEHVGPDSRMGVSRLGLYVDAPNGRSYLYQFASAPLTGVEFERRGALLSPWVSERGKLQLQAFAEALLRQAAGGQSHGLTEQAHLLLERTALSGEVQLSDGLFAMPGVQAHTEGRGEGRNAIRLHSEAVGSGLGFEMASLSVRDATASWGGVHLGCNTIAARLQLELAIAGPQMRFVLALQDAKITGPRLEARRAGDPVAPARRP
jgi:hypothetical protein